jgi:hypothetical protein
VRLGASEMSFFALTDKHCFICGDYGLDDGFVARKCRCSPRRCSTLKFEWGSASKVDDGQTRAVPYKKSPVVPLSMIGALQTSSCARNRAL